MSADQQERTSLTDSDFDKIGEAFDKRLTSLFEVIGYNVTTPESREEIHKDHTFVRSMRGGIKYLIGTAVVAVAGAAAAAWLG
jgi:hypothetical protein